MTPRFTLTLGEFRLDPVDLGPKAGLLDRVARSSGVGKGIFAKRFWPNRARVPEAGIVTDEAYRFALETGLVRIEDGAVVVPSPSALMEAIELPPITGRVAVRSAFTGEDGVGASLAGRYATVLDVPIESYGASPSRVRDPEPLALALAKVWTSGLGHEGRRDALVMRMIDANTSGVAFTERDYEDDLVSLASGETLNLPKLRMFELASRGGNLSFAPRLQDLLRSVRAAVGPGDWDVEWADDGREAWLIQVRPITAPTMRDDLFTYLPIKEGLPETPSRLMTTLIASCGREIFEIYREVDPSLPAGRDYLEVLHGRPMVNLSLMMDLARHWGLPTSAVTWFLPERVPGETGARWRRLLRSRGPRLALRLRSLLAAGKSRMRAREILAIGERPGQSFAEVLEAAREIYIRLNRQMLLLRDAMGRRFSASGRSGVARMLDDLAPLRALVQAHPEWADSLERGEAPRDPEFRRRWEEWLARHGRRGPYETDLARPRFYERPAEILRLIGRAETSVRTRMGARLGSSARAAAAREELRFDAMVAFDRIRRRLIELAIPKGITEEMLFCLTLEEVRSLDGGWRPSGEFMAERRRDLTECAAVAVPNVVRRFDPLEDGDRGMARHGIGLTRGEAVGRALVVREPISALPPGYRPRETILVAPSIDAGWAPCLTLAAGVIVESGGNLSHGSILLRELGLPSVTNVAGATRNIRDGRRLRVVASEGRIEFLS